MQVRSLVHAAVKGTSVDFDSIETLLEQRLATLRGRPIADLLALPKLEKELVKIGGKEVQLFTFHETSADRRHRFILQAIRRSWGGITAKVLAQGFGVSNDQSLRMLEPEELYDFT